MDGDYSVLVDGIWDLLPSGLPYWPCKSVCFTSVLTEFDFGHRCGQGSIFPLCYCCKGRCESDRVREIQFSHSKLDPWGPLPTKDSDREESWNHAVYPIYLPSTVPSLRLRWGGLFLYHPSKTHTVYLDQLVSSYLAHSGGRRRNRMSLILKRLGSKSGFTVKQSSGLYLERNIHVHDKHLKIR